VSIPTPTPFVAKPLREQVPNDFGGIVARGGFAYQDHVAAMFCLEMLSGSTIAEVWCETYDDIVLVWRLSNGGELMEFVQVKQEELQQLYTPSVLLSRDGGKEGTSIFERSISRDVCTESTRFRLVTSRQIVPDLNPLTLSRDDDSRTAAADKFKILLGDMKDNPAASFISAKGVGLAYWLERALWEVHSEPELQAANQIRLMKFLEASSLPVYSDTVEELYQQLLWRVKTAAEAKFTSSRAGKILQREQLSAWLREKASPLPTVGSDAKLREKLIPANQADDAIVSAVEMRHIYNRELRSPSYLSLTHSSLVTEKVRGVLHKLRAKLDAGELDEGEPFLGTCMDKVTAVKDDCEGVVPKPPESILLGCMYEITSRCRHRFIRPKA
jgi:hypothetical protein